MKKRIIYIVLYVFLCPILLYSKSNTEDSSGKFTVVLDAGHGGKDPGALGKRGKEKDIALSITLKTGKYIEENLKDVKVVYTRTTDVFVPLIERAEIANNHKAQLFISIHVNFNPNPKPYGTSTHVMGISQVDDNFEVAKRENSVILLEDDYESKYQNFDPNNPESYIIFSVMQNTYLNQSIEAAALVQSQFKERAQRKDRGVKQQPLMVLEQSSMPGILIETGFISNPNEEAFLMSESGQEYLASAIYRAFRDYKKIIESKSQFSNQNSLEKDGDDSSVIMNSEFIDYTKEDDKSETKGDMPVISDPNKEEDSTAYFRIQISSSYARLEVNSKFFKGLKDVDVYEAEGLYKYVTTKESSYEKIKDELKKVKKQFPDAFIIAVKRDKIISLQQAFRETGLKKDNIN